MGAVAIHFGELSNGRHIAQYDFIRFLEPYGRVGAITYTVFSILMPRGRARRTTPGRSDGQAVP